MSHFCRSPTDDTPVKGVGLSDGAMATAYVWGGASGAEHGQLLDLWSPAGPVRIKPNEATAPGNWIVSYNIPRQHLGLTFVGVKAGTSLRETVNGIRIGLETAAVAKKNCDKFPARQILPSVRGRPDRITANLWQRLLKFTTSHEGITDFFYNDRGNPQLVTCGVGKLVKDEITAVSLKSFFVHPEGREPRDEEMKADHAAAAAMKRDDPPGNLYDFATVTILRMPWEKIADLLGLAMGERVNTMLNMPNFSGFSGFPEDAQLACASIAYGSWQYEVQAPLRAAVRAQDWALAAQVYKSPGWAPSKDMAHIRLFQNAVRR